MAYKFIGKRTSGNGIKNENMRDRQLTEEFIESIWCTDLADMQLIIDNYYCFSKNITWI